MGSIFILLTLLADVPTTIPPQYRYAADTSRRAAMEYPEVKKEIDHITWRGEALVYDYTGLTTDQLAYALYAEPLITQKISTKPFKNIGIKLANGWEIRPEIEYGWGPSPGYSAKFVLATGF